MRTRPRVVLALSLALAVGLVAAPSALRRTPRLVVLISVDQMRADYLDRYDQDWTGGLRRLVDTGALFTRAAYPYAMTVTCAGHATMSTGTLPHRHGMVENTWWDRASGREVTCTTDDTASLVSYMKAGRAGHSLARLRVPTLSDELRTQLSPTPKVAALSLKARSAMTLAGRRADLLLWFEDNVGWTSSSAYTTTTAPFIEAFIAANPVERFRTETWQRMLPERAYLFPDDGLDERPLFGWGRTFPHPYGEGAETDERFFGRWQYSPASDEYLGQLTVTTLERLGLGQGPGTRTDFLGVSFTALDLVGHSFGPRSQEVQDTLARLDRTLGRVFAALDRSVGRGRYVVGFTADHGVAPVGAQQAAGGLGGGRIDGRALGAAIETLMTAAFGPGPYLATPVTQNLYFAPGVWDRLRASPPVLDRVLRLIRETPGVAEVFRADELEAEGALTDPRRRAAALSYYAGRSGDLLIIPEPYWIFGNLGATHGAPYAYDQRVPLILMGQGVKPGEYTSEATPADLAPTLAHLAGVTLPHAEGRVLGEALQPLRLPTRAPGTGTIPR